MKLILISIITYLRVFSFIYGKECGKTNSPNGLIYGGKFVNHGQYPWIVPLLYKRNSGFFCNSNLISAQHLLTGRFLRRRKIV
jgi:secreted trypsin-like serine protease